MINKEDVMATAQAQNVDEILARLDRIEVAVGQLVSLTYGINGPAGKPLLGGFLAKYERRRDEQGRLARVASAQRELDEARGAA